MCTLNQIFLDEFFFFQNIDSLERVAGLPADKLVEAHGTFFTAHCLDCRKEYDLEFIKGYITEEKTQFINKIIIFRNHIQR